jgi:putative membrane protein
MNMYGNKIIFTIVGLLIGISIILSGADQPLSGINDQASFFLKTNQMNATSHERDVQFLLEAAEINMLEMQLGNLAQKKASSIDARDLGKIMEEVHIESFRQLLRLSKQKAITLPLIGTKKAQAAYDRLNEKSHSGFDRAYCSLMVAENIEAIELFENAAVYVKDPEIKVWALQTIPALKSHLSYAIMCQKKCNQ